MKELGSLGRGLQPMLRSPVSGTGVRTFRLHHGKRSLGYACGDEIYFAFPLSRLLLSFVVCVRASMVRSDTGWSQGCSIHKKPGWVGFSVRKDRGKILRSPFAVSCAALNTDSPLQTTLMLMVEWPTQGSPPPRLRALVPRI